MIRAQCLIHLGDHLLMVKHRLYGQEWWCLPGGGVETGETPPEAALRELREECGVSGEILCQTSNYGAGDGDDTITFLVEIGSQVPCLGVDPEFGEGDQILVGLGWLSLAEIPERDRAYLWAAGLLTIPEFVEEVSSWSDDISYPGEKFKV